MRLNNLSRFLTGRNGDVALLASSGVLIWLYYQLGILPTLGDYPILGWYRISCSVLLFLGFLCYFLKTKGISQFTYTIQTALFLFFILPLICCHMYEPTSHNGILASAVSMFVGVNIGQVGAEKWIPQTSTFSDLNHKKLLNILFALCFIGLLPFIFTFRPEFELKNFLFIDTVVTRYKGKEQLNQLTGYLYNNLCFALYPVCLVAAVYAKKWWLVAFLGIGLAYLFLLLGMKGVLFVPLLILILLKGDFEGKARKLSLSICFILLLGIGITFIKSGDKHYQKAVITYHTLAERLLFVQPFMTERYFETYKDNKLIFGHSFLRNFVEYKYDLDPVYFISVKYFGNPKMSSNTGLIGDAYMNLGYFGVLLYSIMNGLLFGYLGQTRFATLFFPVILLLLISIINSPFTTVMLTHGGLLTISLAFLMGPAKKSAIEKNLSI